MQRNDPSRSLLEVTKTIQIKADAKQAGHPFNHFWSLCVGAGRANEGLRAGWLEQLAMVRRDCGFQYLRFHGLFHDDMFVYREVDGRGIFNFQYIDELFDRMLAIGVKPFVEFGFCPADLATQLGTVFWWKGNGSPPKDYGKWAELITRTVRHWIERYGLAEVRSWYFEVWNEPNLHPFFKGTKSQYFELYRVTVRAVKAIDKQLRVGGPATSNFVPDARFAGETEDISQHAVVLDATNVDVLDWRPVWVEDFLHFCQREQLPVDFVSCHPYPTDWALDSHGETVKRTRGIDAARTDLTKIRDIVRASYYPRAEIHLTEWSSSPSPRDCTHDYPQAATFVVKTNLESAGLVDSLSYWTFTDVFEEGGAGDTAFHGGFGMVNYQGIVKPTFHAYRLLHQLGDEVLARTTGAVVTRHRTSGKLTALCYHYPDEVPQSAPASFDTPDVAERTLAAGSPAALEVRLTGLPPNASVLLELLDASHGSAIACWIKLGRPASPSREQLKQLREAALSTERITLRADATGQLTTSRTLSAWSVLLVREE
jgi:xylan 1,4-beta-xylosidase